MKADRSRFLFDFIAPFYNAAFRRHRQSYSRIFLETKQCDFNHFFSILDVGCANGAMASVFCEKGLRAFAVDQSLRMLEFAQKQPESQGVTFLQADARNHLPFPDDSFDIVISSFVAHGMAIIQRQQLYREMKRDGRHLAIVHDYNGNHGFFSTLAEIAEGGDYFNFVRVAEDEIRGFFGNLDVVDTDEQSCCYVCSIL